MKKEINKYFLALVSILTLLVSSMSCRDQLLDFDIDEVPPQLVVGSLFNTDSTLQIKVTRTDHILTNSFPTPYEEYDVADATVELFENDVLISQMLFKPHFRSWDSFLLENEGKYVTDDDFIASAGNQYTVKVSAPGFAAIEATTSILEAIPILDFNVSNVVIPMEWQDAYEGVNASITFQDTPGVENFYAIEGYLEIVHPDYDHPDYDHPENELPDDTSFVYMGILPVLPEKIDYNTNAYQETFFNAYLNDASFEGGEYKFDFILYSWGFLHEFASPDSQNRGLKWHVNLKHITKDHYLYGTTSQLQRQETKENPFSQPVQVYSNVSNNLGIFAGYSMSSRSADASFVNSE